METKDSLADLIAVENEIEAHTARLARAAKLQNATGPLIAQEVGETVMPLLRDFARAVLSEFSGLRDYLHSEIEPLLLEAAGEGDSVLLPEDSALITQRLLAYRAVLDRMVDSATGSDRAQMETERAEVDRALARVAEITTEEGDDDEDGEGGDDDEEGDEDEGPAAGVKQ